MKHQENLTPKIRPNSLDIEVRKNVFQDPKLYFDDFVRRMKSEGYSFEIESNSGISKEFFDFQFKNKKDGRELGKIEAEYKESNKSLKIFYIEGKERGKEDDEWKPSGIASALLAYTLTIYPHTEQIEGRLRYDNIQVYKDSIGRGFSEENALKETPAYKLRAKFGYTNIDLKKWQFPREIEGKMEGKGELVTKKQI